MRVGPALAAATLCVALSACSRPWCPSTSEAPTYGKHELLASIRRTGCFGYCPSYEVRVYRDGVVEYEGIGYVKKVGDVTARITHEQLIALDKLFAEHEYLELDESYDGYYVTDRSTVYTSYRPSGCRTKRIEHYLGDRDAPKQLTAVEQGIDRILDVGQWVGRTREERLEGWGTLLSPEPKQRP